MSVMDASWYDIAMTEPGAPSMAPLAESPWRPLYAEAASWIPPLAPIVDLGCGTGRFADELRNRGHDGGYLGLDFSPATIAEAEEYAGRDLFEFEVADLRDWEPAADRAGGTVYTCLEVLEHLEHDLGLIERVPPGHQLVMSVPSYESASHVRWFRGAGDVWERYAGFLEFRRWSLIALDDRKAIHVLDTRRRTDAY